MRIVNYLYGRFVYGIAVLRVFFGYLNNRFTLSALFIRPASCTLRRAPIHAKRRGRCRACPDRSFQMRAPRNESPRRPR